MTASVWTEQKPAKYTGVAIFLHWVVAALIIVNVILALTHDLAPDSWARPMIDTHKSIGITVLGLVLLRLLWRFSHRPPPLPDTYHPHEKRAAHLAHWLLYGVILALPITGWMHDSAWKAAASHPMSLFGIVPWPRISAIMNLPPETKEQYHKLFGAWHEWLGYGLYLLFALHVGAALKHQFIDKHPELQRMTP
jgi:cytochrome b561